MADTHNEGAGAGADFDLSQFYQIFFEEAGENLDQMEQMLLDLDLSAANDEELNGIFRCAHSIKGGAATFGFSDVAELTHQMESLLDRLRRHELQPIPAMVDVLLDSADASRSLLARHQSGGQGEAVSTADLVRRIAELAAGQAPTATAPVPPVPAPAPAPRGSTRTRTRCYASTSAGTCCRWWGGAGIADSDWAAGAPGAGRRHQGAVPRYRRTGNHRGFAGHRAADTPLCGADQFHGR